MKQDFYKHDIRIWWSEILTGDNKYYQEQCLEFYKSRYIGAKVSLGHCPCGCGCRQLAIEFNSDADEAEFIFKEIFK